MKPVDLAALIAESVEPKRALPPLDEKQILELRRGGGGTHWIDKDGTGCESKHWDCRIYLLQIELDKARTALPALCRALHDAIEVVNEARVIRTQLHKMGRTCGALDRKLRAFDRISEGEPS